MHLTLFSRRSAAAIAILALCAVGGMSHADDARDLPTRSVSYADLNLDTEAGAEQLYFRLRRASLAVCNVESLQKKGSVKAVRQARACYEDAMESAMDALNVRVLAAKGRDSGCRARSTS